MTHFFATSHAALQPIYYSMVQHKDELFEGVHEEPFRD